MFKLYSVVQMYQICECLFNGPELEVGVVHHRQREPARVHRLDLDVDLALRIGYGLFLLGIAALGCFAVVIESIRRSWWRRGYRLGFQQQAISLGRYIDKGLLQLLYNGTLFLDNVPQVLPGSALGIFEGGCVDGRVRRVGA